MDQERIYPTLWELMLDARAHVLKHDAEILSYDNPKALLFGWCAIPKNTLFAPDNIEKTFCLTFRSVRNYNALQLPFKNEELRALLIDLIRTSEGRAKIGQLICSNKKDSIFGIFDRILKLKAFW